ncbi:MAG: phosphoenolpyruvate carboxykinase (ATP) [Bacillota bacterium]|nr:phosphoenolpyruvate carboxykinase (ATP) [Bacillota bacterium]
METYGIEKLGIINPKAVWRNLAPALLVEKALERGEGHLLDNGALAVFTGKYTGRSPNDKFIVNEQSVRDDIAWGKINVPFEPGKFDSIYEKMMSYLQERELFIFDGFAGANKKYRIKVRVVNELASQNLFIRSMLLRPNEAELADLISGHELTVICAPGFKCVPEVDGTRSECAILVSFERKLILIAGSQYAGEMKKSIFSYLNFALPKIGVCSMHCSANIGKDGDTALFFGLSGTGKTTLSADPKRKLIGDDEHGWCDEGIFNFEGGCYAKCIRLSRENEPQIYDAIRFGTLTENVVYDKQTRKPDYDDESVTENTRAGYPVDFIPNAELSGVGGHPRTVVFLTADAFGVMPPVAKLSKEAAMYHFVSGYTSKLAGTERGIIHPEPNFSTCFGAPFLPLHPGVYAKLLGERIEKHGAAVYLINTGWSGGPYGVGKRMSIRVTRDIVTAALNGELGDVPCRHDDIFNFDVPTYCPGVPGEVLNPQNTWGDKAAYERAAQELANKFAENFKAKYTDMPQDIVEAGPKAK